MIAIHDYQKVCDDIFDWPNVDVLPQGKLVYVALEQMHHFFRLCKENPHRRFVIVSGQSDFGLFEQRESPVNNDLIKRVDFVPWQDVVTAPNYVSFRLGPACEPENCCINDRYSIKTYAHTRMTFDEVPQNVLHWFCVNCNIVHNRVSCIPFGVLDHNCINLIKNGNFRDQPKSDKLYVNWTNYTAERAQLKEFYQNRNFAVVQKHQLPLAEFYNELSSFSFCLCPPGNGLDCYRMWEALLCGVYPIVLRSNWANHLGEYFLSTDRLFWGDIDFNKLLQVMNTFDKDSFWTNFDNHFNLQHYSELFRAELRSI